ncbi:hypothetical protein Tco_0864473, partial [Tanacetum coccineum]
LAPILNLKLPPIRLLKYQKAIEKLLKDAKKLLKAAKKLLKTAKKLRFLELFSEKFFLPPICQDPGSAIDDNGLLLLLKLLNNSASFGDDAS